MRERAAAYNDVYVTARQREWLCQLYDRACVATAPEAEEKRVAETSNAVELAKALDERRIRPDTRSNALAPTAQRRGAFHLLRY
jgi:hypothetical protein